MESNTNREGNADDLIYTPEAASVLGMTVETFKVGRATGYAPLHVGKDGSRLVFRRGDLWAWLDARDAGRAKVPCGITGCRYQGYARTGFCPEHAKRIKARGTAEGIATIPRRSSKVSDEERFATFLEPVPATGCIDWVGGDSGNSGYGKAMLNGRKEQAHRVSYFLENGEMPPEELDHECGRRSCVRLGPGHVVPVKKEENMRRMFARQAAEKAAAAPVVAVFPGVGETRALADILAVAESLPVAA